MGKKQIIVIPPQVVSVNVSIDVGAGQAAPAQGQQAQVPTQGGAPAGHEFGSPRTQVNTAVTVGAPPAWGAAPPPVPSGPYVPLFSMPTSDVLRRNLPGLARPASLPLGDHVHSVDCAENGCPLLAASLPPRPKIRPWAMLGWLLVALVVWVIQYSLVVPLAYLGAVARTGVMQAVGWVAILLFGFGPLYALFYLCSPAVPRAALRPWGLNELQ